MNRWMKSAAAEFLPSFLKKRRAGRPVEPELREEPRMASPAPGRQTAPGTPPLPDADGTPGTPGKPRR